MYYNARWYDPGLARFAQADTIIPLASQGVQAWDRYAYVNNNPLRYNDLTGHCISASGFWSIISCAITAVSSTISYIAENPNKVIVEGKKLVVPVVIPAIGEQTTDIVNYPIHFKTIRTVGRLGDDIVPATAAIGHLVTVAPEQIEDFQNGAPISEQLADFVIDSVGFGVSEIAGDIVGGLLSPSVMLAIPGMIVSDAFVGFIYDNYTDSQRKFLQSFIEASQIKQSKPPSPAVPVPTPPKPSPSGTSVPR